MSSTNFRSILIFASCVVGTCNMLVYTRGYAGGLDGRRSQRRIVNIKRVRSNAKS